MKAVGGACDRAEEGRGRAGLVKAGEGASAGLVEAGEGVC